jgi:hypothetical protein
VSNFTLDAILKKFLILTYLIRFIKFFISVIFFYFFQNKIMNNIILSRHEINEFFNKDEILFDEINKTKTIKKFITNNGIASFQLISDIYIICYFCENESHFLRQNKYSYEVLDRLLETNWYEDIFIIYFSNCSLKYFLAWIQTYVTIFFNRFNAFVLEIY